MCKIIGIIMVFFACFIFCYGKVEKIKRKADNLREMLRGLSFMKNDISFSEKEFTEVSKELSQTLHGDCAEVFKMIYKSLESGECLDFGQAWEKAVHGTEKECFLSEETLKLINNFSLQAGTMSKDLEIENIEKTLGMLSENSFREEESYKKNKRLIYTLGGLFACAVLILFM